MVGLGFALFFGGYSLLAYGFGQLRGCNAGLIGIVWPGSFAGCNPDPPGSGGGGGTIVSPGAQSGVTSSGTKTTNPKQMVGVPTSTAQAQKWVASGTPGQKIAGAQYLYVTGQ
jgi:hypothetical protein